MLLQPCRRLTQRASNSEYLQHRPANPTPRFTLGWLKVPIHHNVISRHFGGARVDPLLHRGTPDSNLPLTNLTIEAGSDLITAPDYSVSSVEPGSRSPASLFVRGANAFLSCFIHQFNAWPSFCYAFYSSRQLSFSPFAFFPLHFDLCLVVINLSTFSYPLHCLLHFGST